MDTELENGELRTRYVRTGMDDWRGLLALLPECDAAPDGLYTTRVFFFFLYLPVPRDFRSDTPFTIFNIASRMRFLLTMHHI